MLRALFQKTGNAVYISHLDLMRLFQRAFKRAGLPLTHDGQQDVLSQQSNERSVPEHRPERVRFLLRLYHRSDDRSRFSPR